MNLQITIDNNNNNNNNNNNIDTATIKNLFINYLVAEKYLMQNNTNPSINPHASFSKFLKATKITLSALVLSAVLFQPILSGYAQNLDSLEYNYKNTSNLNKSFEIAQDYGAIFNWVVGGISIFTGTLSAYCAYYECPNGQPQATPVLPDFTDPFYNNNCDGAGYCTVPDCLAFSVCNGGNEPDNQCSAKGCTISLGSEENYENNYFDLTYAF